METRDRVKALREALGLTQAEVARRTAGDVDGSSIYKVESGRNKLSSHRVRAALATAFGLASADLDDYLDGRRDLDDVLSRCAHAPALASREPAHARDFPALRNLSSPFITEPSAPRAPPVESPLEEALLEALDKARHTLRDVDAVRGSLREAGALLRDESELLGAARIWLDAAAQLRHEQVAVTAAALLVRVTLRHARPGPTA